MPAVSNTPLDERVFNAWKAARKSKGAFDNKVKALNKLSAGLDDAGVKSVNAKKEAFLKNENSTVEGKIEV